MKEVSLSGLGALPVFGVSESNPYYYISRYCYEQSNLLKEMETQSFTLVQAESADLEVAETAFDTFIPTLLTWLGGA
jgi:hypothetical protein